MANVTMNSVSLDLIGTFSHTEEPKIKHSTKGILEKFHPVFQVCCLDGLSMQGGPGSQHNMGRAGGGQPH